MARQLNTSLSDLVLALSVYYVFYWWTVTGVSKFASYGILSQGFAASAGVIRFAMVRPEETPVLKIHKFLTWVTTTLGVPMIATGLCEAYKTTAMGNKIIIFALIVIVTARFLPQDTQALSSKAVSGFAMLTIIILSVMYSNWFGLTAAVMYVVAGAIIGAEGSLFGIPRVDLLHYMLTLANFSFLYALLPLAA